MTWTVEAALRAERVEAVCVSSDDGEILDLARLTGAEVVERPAKLSGDTATSEAALLHALDHYESWGRYFDVLAFLQCTSPLTTAADIDGTLAAMAQHGAETAFAAVPFHHFLWRQGVGGAVGVNHNKTERKMRQQRESEFLEAGAVYAMDIAGFREHRHRFFGKTVIYEMPAERCWEIDEPADFDVAEALLRRRLAADAAPMLPRPVMGLVLDFDGVLSNNCVWTSQDGHESVACDRSDGWGLARLREAGLPMTVISTEENPVVAARCRKLKLPVQQGVADKVAAVRAWAGAAGVGLGGVVFVGNDLNDQPLMDAISAAGGCPVAVADCHPDIRPHARLILSRRGGRGAVREICDMILETREQ